MKEKTNEVRGIRFTGARLLSHQAGKVWTSEREGIKKNLYNDEDTVVGMRL